MQRLRGQTWASLALMAVLGGGFVWLCFKLEDKFKANWNLIQAGMPADEVERLLGPPNYNMPAEDQFISVPVMGEYWIYDRPVGLGHIYRRYTVYLINGVVMRTSPSTGAGPQPSAASTDMPSE